MNPKKYETLVKEHDINVKLMKQKANELLNLINEYPKNDRQQVLWSFIESFRVNLVFLSLNNTTASSNSTSLFKYFLTTSNDFSSNSICVKFLRSSASRTSSNK